jgi:phycocyanobilin:ferredoxin oxidoreductase
MSNIWNSLIDVCDFYIETLEKSGIEYTEEGMQKFNKDGWINRTWKSSIYRRAHIDVVDARDTKGLWMMHCCIFPHLNDNSPIFGFDVIAGKNKITGCFIDYSPTVDKDHRLLVDFENMVSQYEWKKVRDLPDWAKRIFSPNMIAASNIKDDNELESIITLAKDSIVCYINNLSSHDTSNDINIINSQEYYGINQRQNPHTPRTMMALGLSQEDVDYFVNNCLFPSIQT